MSSKHGIILLPFTIPLITPPLLSSPNNATKPRHEFKYLVKHCHLFDIPEKAVDDCFNIMDTDKSGQISFYEFFQWAQREVRLNKTNYKPKATVSVINTKERAIRLVLRDIYKGVLEIKLPTAKKKKGFLDWLGLGKEKNDRDNASSTKSPKSSKDTATFMSSKDTARSSMSPSNKSVDNSTITSGQKAPAGA